MASTNRLELIANVAASYLRRNPTSPDQIATVIANITMALDKAAEKATIPTDQSVAAEVPSKAQQSAVSISGSVHRDYLVCLEDGIHVRTLKKHLAVAHGMTPDEYRAKWGLPADYPMVAPEYSERRSKMAKAIGLGRKAVRARTKRSVAAKKKRGKR
ncbi:MAG: MucR family transcriptional regulator [Acetobacteraceae bacterium]|nr:MucR family transcriptional regulator [Acetobacteraceae bacterium]